MGLRVGLYTRITVLVYKLVSRCLRAEIWLKCILRFKGKGRKNKRRKNEKLLKCITNTLTNILNVILSRGRKAGPRGAQAGPRGARNKTTLYKRRRRPVLAPSAAPRYMSLTKAIQNISFRVKDDTMACIYVCFIHYVVLVFQKTHSSFAHTIALTH